MNDQRLVKFSEKSFAKGRNGRFRLSRGSIAVEKNLASIRILSERDGLHAPIELDLVPEDLGTLVEFLAIAYAGLLRVSNV